MLPAIPTIDGMFNVPIRLLEGRVGIAALKKDLTVPHFNAETNETTMVRLYKMRGDNVISLPRNYGKRTFPDIWRKAVNRTKRHDKLHLPIRIKPRDEGQQKFVDDICALFANDNDRGIIDAQANAATGSGKTASACMVQAKLGIGPMLVIVHTNRLKEGWLGNSEQGKGLRFFYGDEWVAKNVGVVQQGVCDYKGKAIVIAMAPSLCSRRYPKEFYDFFSMVVIDELHKMATPVLNQVLGMFRASVRLGLTATPKEGVMARVVNSHVGKPVIVSSQEVLRPKVCRVLFEARCDLRDINGDPADNRNRLITFLSRNRQRQAMLADMLYYRGYKRGRHVLALSDRTDQLLNLRTRLVELGVPYDDIGMYVGAHKTGKVKLTGCVRAGDNVIHFRGLPGFDSNKEAQDHVRATIRSLCSSKAIRQDLARDCSKLSPETHKPTREDYERIERDCPIVLATYGVFDTGIDIKRLDFGVEASPRSNVAQAVGRVLRLSPGKPVPEWYGIYDRLHTTISRVIMGTTQTARYDYKTPSRLEIARRTSYNKQNAILTRMDNPHEALEALKKAA